MEFEIWVYRGLVGVFLAVLYFLFQKWVKRIDSKFDTLIEAVQEQSKEAVRQSGEISNLTKRVDSNDKRLYDHSKRLRTIETNQAKCINFKSK